MAYKNPENQRAASKRHYETHKSDYLARNKRYRSEIQDYIRQIKETTACADCNGLYPSYVMDFDHLGNKLHEISFLTASGRIAALKKEIQKCEIVCSNCHRIRTHTRLKEI